MYSRLDALFRAMPRHAEQIDTRQYIRPKTSDDDRPKKDGNAKPDDQDLWEDHTDISLAALRAFLEAMISGGDEGVRKEGQDEEGPGAAPSAADKRRSPDASKAASAYQKTYRATHTGGEIDGVDIDMANYHQPAAALVEADRKMIDDLLNDIAFLAARHITSLQIVRGDSFAQSLVEAIKIEKARLAGD